MLSKVVCDPDMPFQWCLVSSPGPRARTSARVCTWGEGSNSVSPFLNAYFWVGGEVASVVFVYRQV